MYTYIACQWLFVNKFAFFQIKLHNCCDCFLSKARPSPGRVLKKHQRLSATQLRVSAALWDFVPTGAGSVISEEMFNVQ